MLLPLSRDKATWAAYCDRCLVGSFPYPSDNPRTARYVAIAKLRSIGWTHELPPGLPEAGQGSAAYAWTGETFCFECSGVRQRAALRQA